LLNLVKRKIRRVERLWNVTDRNKITNLIFDTLDIFCLLQSFSKYFNLISSSMFIYYKKYPSAIEHTVYRALNFLLMIIFSYWKNSRVEI